MPLGKPATTSCVIESGAKGCPWEQMATRTGSTLIPSFMPLEPQNRGSIPILIKLAMYVASCIQVLLGDRGMGKLGLI